MLTRSNEIRGSRELRDNRMDYSSTNQIVDFALVLSAGYTSRFLLTEAGVAEINTLFKGVETLY